MNNQDKMSTGEISNPLVMFPENESLVDATRQWLQNSIYKYTQGTQSI